MQIPAAAIRDTAAAVFGDPDFNRTSLLDRVGAWLLDVLQAILVGIGPTRASPLLFWSVIALIGIIVLLLLGRALYGARLMRSGGPHRLRTGPGRQETGDAWRLARELAARGDFTAAAHALYAALLRLIAGRGEIELHDSKTIGDYVRDLRARSSGRLPGFRDFAQTYETVIYGLGFCDRDRYEQLHGLARRVNEASG
ncbi:MAG: DUF4129 domain-containing protein [Longimicrobiales bacterium]